MKSLSVWFGRVVGGAVATLVWAVVGVGLGGVGGVALGQTDPRIEINAVNTPGDADSVFKIWQPGSYILEANVVGVAGKHGIEIAASGVTLDLNGFEIRGPGGVGFYSGVATTVSGLRNAAVVNGTIRSWPGQGIDLRSFGTSPARIEGVLSSGNVSDGIRASGGTVVRACSASFNSGFGIYVGDGSVVSDCAARGNGNSGFYVNIGAAVIDRCTATSNLSHGFDLGQASSITQCIAQFNRIDGIRVLQECSVRENACAQNGFNNTVGAGVHATSSGNRIEGNNCTLSKSGIDADTAGNFIARNTCRGNALNWDIAAGNACLVVNATLSGAISGNAGGVSPGSSDPNANFTY